MHHSQSIKSKDRDTSQSPAWLSPSEEVPRSFKATSHYGPEKQSDSDAPMGALEGHSRRSEGQEVHFMTPDDRVDPPGLAELSRGLFARGH